MKLHALLDMPEDHNLYMRPSTYPKDDLRHRFSDMLGARSINTEELRTFEDKFELYAVHLPHTSYWTESSLIRFLREQLPADLAYHVADAGPILFRSLIRLGSFPYLLEPIPFLTKNALRTAVILLCRRSIWPSRDPEVSDFWLARLARKRRRLLFQSMMQKYATVQYISRTDKDDEDLNDALDAVEEEEDSVIDVPTAIDREPTLPPASAMPSSNSGELGGTIRRHEFRSWLRLVLLSRLEPTGDVKWRQELERVTDSIMNCFAETDHESENDIDWHSFDKAKMTSMPLLHIGLSKLFEPLITVQSPQASFSIPGWSYIWSQPGAQTSHTTKDGKRLPPQELTHPIICQLATFLPIVDPRDHIVLSSKDFVKYAADRTSPGLMLLSGLGITSQSSNAISHVIYGAFFGALPDTGAPFDKAGQVCIFQLAPVHRVFVATRAPKTSDALDLTFSKEVARRGFKVELVTEKSEMVELIIEEGMKNASFAQWASHQDDGSEMTLIGESRNEDENFKANELFGDFRIEDLKLLGFPRRR